MKTFADLVEEIQKPGLCHHCGGCVTFCTAINYGALELDADGKPRFRDRDKCIECGLCYSICPEIEELEDETRRLVGWQPPMGRVIEVHAARARDRDIRRRATDGGVVTALLIHLFDQGHIDGAIVTRQVGAFHREPWLATTRDEILEAAGFYFDTSHGMKHFGDGYSLYSDSIREFRPLLKKGLRRVAMVGTPCQIKAIRKMETLGIVPSDSVKYTLGLFCSGNFQFGPQQREHLEKVGNFRWQEVKKINIKETFMVHLHNGDVKTIPLNEMDAMKRYACRFCPDYAAEYADISFGGIGAEEGWTTVVTRTPYGRAIFVNARASALDEFVAAEGDRPFTRARQQIIKVSGSKKASADANRQELLQSRRET